MTTDNTQNTVLKLLKNQNIYAVQHNQKYAVSGGIVQPSAKTISITEALNPKNNTGLLPILTRISRGNEIPLALYAVQQYQGFRATVARR